MKEKRLNLPAAVKPLYMLFILFAVLSAAQAAKIYPSAGSTSASFLKIPAGAGPSGTGGASGSYPYDGYASYYNPALLALYEGKRISFSHNDYFWDFTQDYLEYSLMPKKSSLLGKISPKKGIWAFSVNYFSTPKNMERRSGLYESDPLYPLSPSEGKFSARDMAAGAHYGFSLSERTHFGYGLKFINQKIDSDSASSFAADAGIIRKYRRFKGDLYSAFVIENLGPKMKFSSRSYELPLSFRLSASYKADYSDAVFSAEILKYIDNYPYILVGARKPLGSRFFLRAGYRYRINGNELGFWSGAAAGFGFASGKFNFDYAINPYGDLGYAHKIGVTFFWGQNSYRKKPDVYSAGEMRETESYDYLLLNKITKLSARSPQYLVTAENADAFVQSVSFKSRSRPDVSAKSRLVSGELNKQSGYFEENGKTLKTFFISYPAVSLRALARFKIPKEWLSGGKKLFIYKPGIKKETAELSPAGEDAEFLYYEAQIELNSIYILSAR